MATVKQRIGPTYDRIIMWSIARALVLVHSARTSDLSLTGEDQELEFLLSEITNWIDLRDELAPRYAPNDGT